MKVFAFANAAKHVDIAEFQPEVREEAAFVWQMVQAGVVQNVHFRSDGRVGVVMELECASLAEAQALIANLPTVKAGALDFTLMPVEAGMQDATPNAAGATACPSRRFWRDGA
jgi:hypothetical protein